MNVSLLSSFTAFELTPEEELAGLTFNEAQRAVIQNHISAAAEDILRLTLAAEPTAERNIEIAYAQGQIGALKYLLDSADQRKELQESLKPVQPE